MTEEGGRRRLVGITGHRGRPLPGADPPLLEARVDGVLAGLTKLGMRDLVSPLAEGADRAVAFRALVAGWCLQALLPFEVARYEEDFHSPESVREFRELLGSATEVEVVPTRPDPDLAYRPVGAALLDRVAVLVAVWDGHPPRGPGGTGEVVQEAVRRGIPVVWIGSGAPHELRLLEPGVPGARMVGNGAGALPSLLGRWLGRAEP